MIISTPWTSAGTSVRYAFALFKIACSEDLYAFVVPVAPETLLMFALCADRASLFSFGHALFQQFDSVGFVSLA
jgi:hypothetical protein